MLSPLETGSKIELQVYKHIFVCGAKIWKILLFHRRVGIHDFKNGVYPVKLILY